MLSTADFDRLTDMLALPPLVLVQEAADGLGMTRQGVLKAIKGKVLPATRVGGTWVLQRSVVDSARARRGA
ncbi:helix-turn-helix domain-containing protein [Rhodococcus koreensis]